MLIFGKTKEEKFYRIASEKYSSEACTRILLHWSPALCQCAGFFKSLTKRTLSRLCVFGVFLYFPKFCSKTFFAEHFVQLQKSSESISFNQILGKGFIADFNIK